MTQTQQEFIGLTIEIPFQWDIFTQFDENIYNAP